MYEEVEVYKHAFLNSALGAGETLQFLTPVLCFGERNIDTNWSGGKILNG